MPRKETGPLNNYNIALKRMHSTEKLFHKKACFKVIDEEVQKLLDQGFVVKVAPEQVDHSQPEWYLPLQVVFTPERTTKGHDGLSLNNYLEKGPNYINSLPNILATWRWDNVAYTGDDHKMFNEILVHSYDQVYHRFLWRSDTSDPPSLYQWLRLNFGNKPAPETATNSINTQAKVSQAEFPEAAKELQDHVYVDDNYWWGQSNLSKRQADYK